jgi:hypothetical protein
MSFLQIPDAMVAPEWPPSEPLALPAKFKMDREALQIAEFALIKDLYRHCIMYL